MNRIKLTESEYADGKISKQDYIERMYGTHHSLLFDFADYIYSTNIRKIEIENGEVVTTSRDRGIRIACPVGDFRSAPMEILNFSDYELDETLMVEKLIRDNYTVFDIGANIGWNALNVAVTYRNARVYCFEPIPNTFQTLLRNIELNAVRNVTAHNFGFSDRSGNFPFYYYPGGSVNASSVNLSERADVIKVSCNVQTLDEYTAEQGIRIDFIKCDVEGAELLVFRGGARTLANDTPIVFSEILRKWSARFNYDPNEIFTMFRQLGYRAFTASGGQLHEFHQMEEDTLETNFFFLHEKKHAEEIRRNTGSQQN